MIEQKKLIDLLYAQDIPLQKAAKKLNMTDEEVKKRLYEEYQRLSDDCKRLFKDSLLNISIQ
jgi:DNA-directed RNA polymerase specialized sigma24 family protein